jgi:mono/diheme cytochrome c family protein
MTFRSGCGLATVLSPLLFSGAADAADARHGATIAKRWCAACHIVTNDQKSGSADVPPFAAIARRHTDAKALAAFLINPHLPTCTSAARKSTTSSLISAALIR